MSAAHTGRSRRCRHHADTRFPTLRGHDISLRFWLVCVSSDYVQPDVGRWFRYFLDVQEPGRLVPSQKSTVPGFADYFDKTAPADMQSFSPSFLAAFKEPGVVQIWSGLIARTAPEWSLLIRSPVNLAHSQGYEHYEGIIETDRWFGPLFTNVRLNSDQCSRRVQ